MTKTERGTLIKEASRHNKMASLHIDDDRHLNQGEKKNWRHVSPASARRARHKCDKYKGV